jgi:hypothetical protein
MMTVRKVVEGIGVEKTFPLYSPVIAKIQVMKTPMVRRSKLFYMRDLTGKATRLRSKIGMTEKDEKFVKKASELLKGMGLDLKQPQPEAVAAETVTETPKEKAKQEPVEKKE